MRVIVVGALHLAYFLVELPDGDVPHALILPTADGFHTTAYYNVQPMNGRLAIVHAEMKGAASNAAKHQADASVRDALWADIVSATPRMGDCHIADFVLFRNDAAIVKPYPGYLRALRRFSELTPPLRLRFAGDYLITSTVGQVHYTGLRAAEALLT